MREVVKRTLGIFLAGAVSVSLMAGCTQPEDASDASAGESVSEEKTVSAGGIAYPLDTDETLSIVMLESKQISSVSGHISQTPFAKAWSEQTGVDLEFTTVKDDDAMRLLFADGDLPDIVFWKPYSYAGGPVKAVLDGVLEPISLEELQAHAPDFARVIDASVDDVRRTIKMDNGEYIGFPMILDAQELQCNSGMVLRADWLKEFGMEVPNTIPELEAYLQACVDKGIEYPLPSVQLDGPMWYGLWTTPFHLPCAEEYQIDGKVYCGWAQPEYKDVLIWLKSLADRGLMDTSFTERLNGIYGDKMAVWFSSIGSGIGTILTATEETRPEFDLQAMPSLVAEEGDIPMMGYEFTPVHTLYYWITPQCENKELALQFLNYGYTDAGHLLFNFGVEGESYTMVDGVPTYTEQITHNADGLSMQYALAQYSCAATPGGPFVQSTVYAQQYFGRPRQQEAIATWGYYEADKYAMPRYQVAQEDVAEFNKIAANINDYVAEARIQFITGELSLDDYDAVYIQTLKEMGYDRYLEILQDACDRYYAR